MTSLGEGLKEHASFSTKGLDTVNLHPSYGEKHQQGSLDYWNYPGIGVRLIVVTDRALVGKDEEVIPGIGKAENQVTGRHLEELHKKGVIRNPIIGRPHSQASVVRVPEEIFPKVTVSNVGVEVEEGVQIDPDVARKAREIFEYGQKVHEEAGNLTLEHAQMTLGRFHDGKFTVVGQLFTPESMGIAGHFSFGPRGRRYESMVLYHAFVARAEVEASSQAEVSNAIDLHFNPAGVK